MKVVSQWLEGLLTEQQKNKGGDSIIALGLGEKDSENPSGHLHISKVTPAEQLPNYFLFFGCEHLLSGFNPNFDYELNQAIAIQESNKNISGNDLLPTDPVLTKNINLSDKNLSITEVLNELQVLDKNTNNFANLPFVLDEVIELIRNFSPPSPVEMKFALQDRFFHVVLSVSKEVDVKSIIQKAKEFVDAPLSGEQDDSSIGLSFMLLLEQTISVKLVALKAKTLIGLTICSAPDIRGELNLCKCLHAIDLRGS